MQTFRLQKIDASLIAEHRYLNEEDHCYFFGEYASRQGFSFSPMNQLIINFKRPVLRKSHPEWRYKQKAISDVAELLLASRNWEKLRTWTWIPMPPSQMKTDQEYDDRLCQVLHKIKEKEPNIDIRDVLLAKLNRPAAHLQI